MPSINVLLIIQYNFRKHSILFRNSLIRLGYHLNDLHNNFYHNYIRYIILEESLPIYMFLYLIFGLHGNNDFSCTCIVHVYNKGVIGDQRKIMNRMTHLLYIEMYEQNSYYHFRHTFPTKTFI